MPKETQNCGKCVILKEYLAWHEYQHVFFLICANPTHLIDHNNPGNPIILAILVLTLYRLSP
jgi:hypothetical protein